MFINKFWKVYKNKPKNTFCFSNTRGYDSLFYSINRDSSLVNHYNSHYRKSYYINSLDYLTRNMEIIKNRFEDIVFHGPYPEMFLMKLPPFLRPDIFIFFSSEIQSLELSYKNIKYLIENDNNDFPFPTIENIHGILVNHERKNLPFINNSISCFISHMMLHSAVNLEEEIKQIIGFLIPDGCFISNFISEGSFYEINTAFSLAEQEREGGIGINYHNLPSFYEISQYLTKYNVNLTSFSVNKYLNMYDSMSDAIDFIKHNGESNSNINRRINKSKDTFIAAVAIYEQLYNLKKIYSNEDDINLLYSKYIKQNFTKYENPEHPDYLHNVIVSTYENTNFIGWKYSENQQKPLTRGSAEVNLKDIFEETIEEKNNIRYGLIVDKTELEGGLNFKKEEVLFEDDDCNVVDLTERMKEKVIEKIKNRKKSEENDNIIKKN